MIPSNKLKDNPIVKRRSNLFQGGGFSTPLSIDYNSFQELIEELLEKNDYKTAMLMKQNYGLLMSFEPEETVQCHHFNIDIWQENFRSEMFSIYPERKI